MTGADAGTAATQLAEIRARHVPNPYIPIQCSWCADVYPCDAIRLCDVAVAARDASDVFWSFSDTEGDRNIRNWLPHPDVIRAMSRLRAALTARADRERGDG